MKILACFYTNNKLRPELLRQSLGHFFAAAANGPVIPVVSSWRAIPNLTCRNLQSHFRLDGHGHLNILLQLLQVVYSCDEPWDYFAFCEHDCLYPENYFSEITETLSRQCPRGVTSENHWGLCSNGYVDCWRGIQPLFGMMLRRDVAVESLQKKMRECTVKGSCCIEPDNRDGWLIRPVDDETPPILHVNMNTTTECHHLTNHYDSYSSGEPQPIHKFWGDYRSFGIFTEQEIHAATQPIFPRGTYQIVKAEYGDFGTCRVVSYLDALKERGYLGHFRVSNSGVNTDPAPGVVKELRITVVKKDTGDEKVVNFREGTAFVL